MHFPDPAGVRYEMECEGLRVCSLLLLKSGYKDADEAGRRALPERGALHAAADPGVAMRGTS